MKAAALTPTKDRAQAASDYATLHQVDFLTGCERLGINMTTLLREQREQREEAALKKNSLATTRPGPVATDARLPKPTLASPPRRVPTLNSPETWPLLRVDRAQQACLATEMAELYGITFCSAVKRLGFDVSQGEALYMRLPPSPSTQQLPPATEQARNAQRYAQMNGVDFVSAMKALNYAHR